MIELNNVPPRPPVNNITDGALLYSEAVRYLILIFSACAPLTDFSHVALAQLCRVVVLSAWLIGATLTNFILHIIGMCSKEEVTRVAARRVIAVMQDIHTSRNLAIRHDPRLPVSVFLPAATAEHSIFVSRLGLTTSRPWPTRIKTAGLIDLIPKVLDAGNSCWHPVKACALVVFATQPLRKSLSVAVVNRARLVGLGVWGYGVLSHGEKTLSCCGQRRRTVSSGRRFAFMPQNQQRRQATFGRAA